MNLQLLPDCATSYRLQAAVAGKARKATSSDTAINTAFGSGRFPLGVVTDPDVAINRDRNR